MAACSRMGRRLTNPATRVSRYSRQYLSPDFSPVSKTQFSHNPAIQVESAATAFNFVRFCARLLAGFRARLSGHDFCLGIPRARVLLQPQRLLFRRGSE